MESNECIEIQFTLTSTTHRYVFIWCALLLIIFYTKTLLFAVQKQIQYNIILACAALQRCGTIGMCVRRVRNLIW